MLISLIAVATTVAVIERFPFLRLRRQRFFRNFFASDILYLLTGFIAGGSLALAYVTHAGQFLGTVLSLPRLATFPLPLWIAVILAVIALDLIVSIDRLLTATENAARGSVT